VGFSAFVSVGSMLDVSWGDLIDYLGDDPFTKSILIYMESIGDARAFLSAAREVALTKPIIVIKVGRTEQGAKAAGSHTGALTENDDVISAAFRRAGVLRVERISDLFHMAEVLGKQPRPRGPRLAIVTNAGGPGALATDQLVYGGGVIAALSPKSKAALDELLPPFWSRGNPIDILGDANAERYAKAVEIVAEDPSNDGILVVLTPQTMAESTLTAERICEFSRVKGKPVLASWMGGESVGGGESVLSKAGIPVYAYPDTAARVFCFMWEYAENLHALYETPSLSEHSVESESHREKVARIIAEAREEGRTLLTSLEAKKILVAYGIPVVETHLALSEEAAVEFARQIGAPVALKLHSKTITHKAQVGGVKLNVCGANAVKKAWRAIRYALVNEEDFSGVLVQPMMDLASGYELILGSSTDPHFGPVLMFGAGGRFVEVSRDRVLGLPPLNATLARRIMERTCIYDALVGKRGHQPLNLAELEQILVRFSHLIAEQPWIAESDINPLFASQQGFCALDARFILHPQSVTTPPQLAIRPYPTQYVSSWQLKNGKQVIIRPIRPEDELAMVQFHKTLSERSVRYRYCAMLNLDYRIAHERLTRICFNDYDREIALVVERKQQRVGQNEILGVGRLTRLHGTNDAEFAIVISDSWQRQGLGGRLLKLLVEVARAEKCSRILGHILPDNSEMRHLAKRVGFTLQQSEDGSEYEAVYPL
jgi:acetyltransferase